MARQASVSRIITYAHIPCTPVLDGSGKWTYKANPALSEINSTLDRLSSYESKISAAEDKALAAQQSADAAKKSVAGKATPEEAVEEVRNTLFKAYDIDGEELEAEKLQFIRTADGWQVSFCIIKPPVTAGGMPVGYCQTLSYPSLSDFRALQSRISVIESRLGIK